MIESAPTVERIDTDAAGGVVAGVGGCWIAFVAFTAAASADCVSDEVGAKVAGEEPRMPAAVTSLICDAAQFVGAAAAEQAKTAASAATRPMRDDVIRRTPFDG